MEPQPSLSPGASCSSDPPIDTYSSSSDDDRDDERGRDDDSRERRRQLRELALDEAWDDTLSDEGESNSMPRWEANLVRRKLNHDRAERKTSSEDSNGSGSINMHTSCPSQSQVRLKRSCQSPASTGLSEESLQSHDRGNGTEVLKGCPTGEERATEQAQYTETMRQINLDRLTHPRSESPLFPEEEYDNASTVASSNGKSNRESSRLKAATPVRDGHDAAEAEEMRSPLHSLPQRPICPFPEEADRKRIVGCLAAILACSYPYETAPLLMVKERQQQPVDHSSYAYDAGEDDSTGNAQSTMPESNDDGLLKYENSAASRALKPTPCSHDPLTISTGQINGDHPHLQQHKKQQRIIEQTRSPPRSGGGGSFSNPFGRAQSMPVQAKGEKQPARSPLGGGQFSFAALKDSNASQIFKKGSSTQPPTSLTAELAEVRHRIRRHAILSELLVSSAEMLLLDKSHARAFLPMLEGLLSKVEEPAKDESIGQSWKGRGFGGVSMPSLDDEMMSPRSQPRSEPIAAELEPAEKEAELDSGEPGVLLESFPAKRSMSFSSPPRPSPPPTYAPLETVIVDKDLVAPFLQSLTPGAGFRCIALLLLNHLLRDGRGYDARVRQAFKRLAVVVLSHELKVGGILRPDLDEAEDLDSLLWGDQDAARGEEGADDSDDLALLATRKFEAMEHSIAAKLIEMSKASAEKERQQRRGQSSSEPRGRHAPSSSNMSSSSHGRIALAPKETPMSSNHGVSKEQIMRGIKVGAAGAVGATLFALTGGLAAPGIAAGLAAVAGTSAIAAGVSTVLSSAAAITTIFGVGGAGLASYKMHRRTKGLTEFDFQKEPSSKSTDAELFSTVCISGWLRDPKDFQRPWGVSPSHPRIVDKQELLERFYYIHNPDNIPKVPEILKHWKGRYFLLWKSLREKYGTDPSNLFPLVRGSRITANLTHEEGEAVDYLLGELGYTTRKKNERRKPAEAASVSGTLHSSPNATPNEARKQSAQQHIKDSSLKPKKSLLETMNAELARSGPLSLFSEDTNSTSINDGSTHTVGSMPASSKNAKTNADIANNPPPKHLLTVWDWQAIFGGELYTVRWESELLMELSDSVTDQMLEWTISATKTILHTTVFATLMTAVTIPYSLALAANAIDSSWTMAMERADRAGVELAKSLIDSTAGHRPVVLVGYSMGARVIYSCLKELAKHQETWEAHQQKKKLPKSRRRRGPDPDKDVDKLKYIREPASIVEDVIFMGMPNHVSIKSWEACRRVVAGRMINAYSTKDLILSLMFQMKRFQGILRPVCGTSPVAVNGIENYDVTDLVSAHTDYCLVAGEILKRVHYGQPQRPTDRGNEMVDTMGVTEIKVASHSHGLASLSDEAVTFR